MLLCVCGTEVVTFCVHCVSLTHFPVAPAPSCIYCAFQGNAGVFEDVEWVTPTPAWSAVRKSRIGSSFPSATQTNTAARNASTHVSDCYSPPPAFNFAVCCAGYGRFEVYNSTHLFYESLELETRAPMDSFWLIKDRE